MCTITEDIKKQLDSLSAGFADALRQVPVKSADIGKISYAPIRTFNDLMAYGAFPERTGVQLQGNTIWHFYNPEREVDIYYSAIIVDGYGEVFFNFDANSNEYIET